MFNKAELDIHRMEALWLLRIRYAKAEDIFLDSNVTRSLII